MAILNGSFEDAGNLPGEAQGWTLITVTRLEEFGGFGATPEQAWEDFERWHEFVSVFEDAHPTRAFFDQDGFEAFEQGWGAEVYLWELPRALVVPCPFSATDIEHCEMGWGNDSFSWDFTMVPSSVADFSGAPYETFETGWRSNEAFVRLWASVPAEAAQFGDSQSIEDFEQTWAPANTI